MFVLYTSDVKLCALCRQALCTYADAIDHYIYQVNRLRHEIESVEEHTSVVRSTGVGFVTFHDKPTATICEQLLLNRRADMWVCMALCEQWCMCVCLWRSAALCGHCDLL